MSEPGCGAGSLGCRGLPWSGLRSPADDAPLDTPRAVLETPADTQRVYVLGTGEALAPLTSDARGRTWELPGTGALAGPDGGQASEVLRLELRAGGRTHSLALPLRGLPRPTPGEETSPEHTGPQLQTPWLEAASQAEALIARHVEAVYDATGRPAPRDSLGWRRGGGHRVTRELSDFLLRWRKVGATRDPRLALIVRLAGQLPRFLSRVCARPRVILRRDRELRPVGRVQELDPACIRWLARQPGLRVAEKAGIKQQVLGVVRVEDADTHENRVVKDLLRRASSAARLYLREHRSFGDHERIDLVRGFERQLRRWSTNSPIASVGGLVGVPAPNYVLQHDERYAPLWRAYVALLRQQNLLDSAWRWRHRVWSETVVLACLTALLPPDHPPDVRSDVLLHAEHVSGRFIDPETVVGSQAWAPDVRLDFVLGPDQAQHYTGGVLASLVRLAPDLILVLRREGLPRPARVVAIWGLLDFQLQSNLEAWLRGLDQELPGIAHHGLLVLPAALQSWPRPPTVGRCAALTLPPLPQRGLDPLQDVLRRLLA